MSLKAPPQAVEAAAEALRELTGAGVSLEPPIEALGPDEGYQLDSSAPWTLRAYARGDVGEALRRRAARALRRAGLADVVSGLSCRVIREEDWAEAWKAHYDIERVGEVVVRPAWKEYAPRPGEVVVALDPGIAFGTGQHPTTRMCLQALQDPAAGVQGATVLDLGCGSGILAIAAALLGAGRVLAVDIEEQAVAATRSNAALNGLDGRITVRQGSLDATADWGQFDVVLANINAATLSALAPGLAAALRPGGLLVASGIIAAREASCRSALAEAGLRVEQALAEGEWHTLLCRH